MTERKIETPGKKEMLLGAIRLWAVAEGMDEIEDEKYTFGADKAFIKDKKTYAFLTEIDKTSEELKMQTATLKCFYDYIYVITNDRQKRKCIEETTIKGVGIMCNSNPFGLGQMFEVLKQAELLN
jgi:hypothetical protein